MCVSVIFFLTFDLPERDLEVVRENKAHPVVIDEDEVVGGERVRGHRQEQGPGDETTVCMQEVDLERYSVSGDHQQFHREHQKLSGEQM